MLYLNVSAKLLSLFPHPQRSMQKKNFSCWTLLFCVMCEAEINTGKLINYSYHCIKSVALNFHMNKRKKIYLLHLIFIKTIIGIQCSGPDYFYSYFFYSNLLFIFKESCYLIEFLCFRCSLLYFPRSAVINKHPLTLKVYQ